MTPLERTVLDCASSMPTSHGLVVADSGLRAGADPAVLDDLLRAAKGDRGVRRARQVVGLADIRSESPGETLTRYAIHGSGLPAPELQVPVSTSVGVRWLDLGWVDAKVGVEFDGAVKYGVRPDEVRRALREERRRQDALEDEGWALLRLAWPDLARPEQIGARAARLLREHRPSPRSRPRESEIPPR